MTCYSLLFKSIEQEKSKREVKRQEVGEERNGQ